MDLNKKVHIFADPGSKEGDFTGLTIVQDEKILSMNTSQSNEIKMLRLFKLLCGGQEYIGEKILIKNLSITKEEAKEAIMNLVGKRKLEREFVHNIWKISRGDKLLDQI